MMLIYHQPSCMWWEDQPLYYYQNYHHHAVIFHPIFSFFFLLAIRKSGENESLKGRGEGLSSPHLLPILTFHAPASMPVLGHRHPLHTESLTREKRPKVDQIGAHLTKETVTHFWPWGAVKAAKNGPTIWLASSVLHIPTTHSGTHLPFHR